MLKNQAKMNILRLSATFFLLTIISCNTKSENVKKADSMVEKTDFSVLTEKISQKNLPKEIGFEGKLKEIIKFNDSEGGHIILLTETGEIPSKKIINIDDETDFKIFAYSYLLDKTDNQYKLNWKIQDFVSNCEFDLLMGFLKNTFKITDLDKNGKAEVWTMYQMGCVSDVSPIEMKIIMHQGKQKFALRGNSMVNTGTGTIGGAYKLDENLSTGPNEFKEFALKMWRENNIQKYE